MSDATSPAPDVVMVPGKSEDVMRRVCGPTDAHLRYIRDRFGATVGARGEAFVVRGAEDVQTLVAQGLRSLVDAAERGTALTLADVRAVFDTLAHDDGADVANLLRDDILMTQSGRPVRPRTVNQKRYVTLIDQRTVTFGIGPAGTGKTYLAVAMAVAAFRRRRYERIILTRPAVEAGERLGFLPGDLEAKINPYLRPLYDALYDFLGAAEVSALLDERLIEVAPLAFMRGRTLHRAFVILDEAQNTTRQQMKMFLTRLGEGSKMVINGDLTQIDLERGARSGLKQAVRILGDTDDVGAVRFDERDVIRHVLVQRIIRAYERDEGKAR